jgi:hypothetical protein
MLETITPKNISLKKSEKKFNLQRATEPDFFQECRENLPEISELQKQLLDKVKAGYLSLLSYQKLPENSLKKTVVAPLLFIGGFSHSPFHLEAEKSIEVVAENDGKIFRGNIDTVVWQNKIWIMAIESKEANFSLGAALPQILASMLSNKHLEQPAFGAIATGETFTFIKLVKGKNPKYATSGEFSLRNPGNDLYQVLSILKNLSQG